MDIVMTTEDAENSSIKKPKKERQPKKVSFFGQFFPRNMWQSSTLSFFIILIIFLLMLIYTGGLQNSHREISITLAREVELIKIEDFLEVEQPDIFAPDFSVEGGTSENDAALAEMEPKVNTSFLNDTKIVQSLSRIQMNGGAHGSGTGKGAGFGEGEGGFGGQMPEWTLKSLRWLKSRQNDNGSWGHFPHIAARCAMAYMAAGVTIHSEEFGDSLQKAMDYLDSNINASSVPSLAGAWFASQTMLEPNFYMRSTTYQESTYYLGDSAHSRYIYKSGEDYYNPKNFNRVFRDLQSPSELKDIRKREDLAIYGHIHMLNLYHGSGNGGTSWNTIEAAFEEPERNKQMFTFSRWNDQVPFNDIESPRIDGLSLGLMAFICYADVHRSTKYDKKIKDAVNLILKLQLSSGRWVTQKFGNYKGGDLNLWSYYRYREKDSLTRSLKFSINSWNNGVHLPKKLYLLNGRNMMKNGETVSEFLDIQDEPYFSNYLLKTKSGQSAKSKYGDDIFHGKSSFGVWNRENFKSTREANVNCMDALQLAYDYGIVDSRIPPAVIKCEEYMYDASDGYYAVNIPKSLHWDPKTHKTYEKTQDQYINWQPEIWRINDNFHWYMSAYQNLRPVIATAPKFEVRYPVEDAISQWYRRQQHGYGKGRQRLDMYDIKGISARPNAFFNTDTQELIFNRDNDYRSKLNGREDILLRGRELHLYDNYTSEFQQALNKKLLSEQWEDGSFKYHVENIIPNNVRSTEKMYHGPVEWWYTYKKHPNWHINDYGLKKYPSNAVRRGDFKTRLHTLYGGSKTLSMLDMYLEKTPKNKRKTGYLKWLMNRRSQLFGLDKHKEAHSTALALIALLQTQKNIKIYTKFRLNKKSVFFNNNEESLDIIAQ